MTSSLGQIRIRYEIFRWNIVIRYLIFRNMVTLTRKSNNDTIYCYTPKSNRTWTCETNTKYMLTQCFLKYFKSEKRRPNRCCWIISDFHYLPPPRKDPEIMYFGICQSVHILQKDPVNHLEISKWQFMFKTCLSLHK